MDKMSSQEGRAALGWVIKFSRCAIAMFAAGAMGSANTGFGQLTPGLAESVQVSPAVSKATIVAHEDPSKMIRAILTLPLKDPDGAADFARRVSDPSDSLYGHYLTPQEFAARYGADERDYQALKQWAIQQGLAIEEESVSRTLLTVRGTVNQFEGLFKTSINRYQKSGGEPFYSAASSFPVPSGLLGRVSGIIGLTSVVQYAPMVIKNKNHSAPHGASTETAGGTGPGGGYSAADIRTAYGIPTYLSPRKSQTVAVFEQGGFSESDIQEYQKQNHLPNIPVKVRNVNGYNGAIIDPNIELEAVLDIDMVTGINPNVAEVQVYEDGDDPFAVALLDGLSAMANDNKAKTISISYGTDESIQGATQMKAENAIFEQMAAQGQTVFVSAGDQGAYGRSGDGLNVEDPASQPYVASVGGTNLYTGPMENYLTEEVWNLLGATGGATGGGISNQWPIPSYQSRKIYEANPSFPVNGSITIPRTVMATVTGNGGSSVMRNVPDVAAIANPMSGVVIYSASNGGWVQIGGTSVGSPLWAGFVSILAGTQEILGLPHFGFIAPELYYLAFTSGSTHDITDGSNGNAAIYGIPGYNAGPGYDNCTGLGSMIGENFALESLTRPVTASGKYPSAPTGLSGVAGTKSATISWTATPGATGYLVQANRTDSNSMPNTSLSVNYVTSTHSIKLTGLVSKKTYLIEVIAINRSGANATTFYLTTR
jgi:subtilase family serine protease